MEKTPCPFGQIFREQRISRGISLWNLSVAVPYRQGNIQRIERGLHEPRLGLGMRMLSALDVDAGIVLDTLARMEGLIPGEATGQGEALSLPAVLPEKETKPAACPFGTLLRAVRLAHGKSQKIAAESAGYTLRNLINVEKGTQEPGIMLALRLLIASGGAPKEFFRHLQEVMRQTGV